MPHSQSSEMPNLLQLLRPDQARAENGIEDGDCGIILKLDGSFKMFATGVEGLKNPAAYGERELQQIENGKLLSVLALVLSTPQLLQVVTDVGAGLIDPEKLGHVIRPN